MRLRRSAVVAASLALIGLTAGSAQGVAPRTTTAVDALAVHGLVSSGTVTMTSAGTVDAGGVAVTLPAAGPGRTHDRTTALASTLPETTLAVQRDELGATRIMSVATGPAAPRDVTYRVPGASLEPQADGTVLVRRGGRAVASIAAPWALDATGQQVATSYLVADDTLTQRTHFDASTAFPVVSDPSVSGCLWGVLPAICTKYNRAETARINTAVTAGVAVAASAVCDVIPHVAYRTACRALLAARFADLVNTVNRAQRERRCLLMKFPYPILPGYVTYYVVNC